ncbi:Arv1-domain-containing protein [Agrocybe pediades]|nr:Arv1-domain-containing protein [Agrocybe pediades]
MPICTSCTHSISYLYTVYESENNLRLEQCPKCHEFVDPYVEHDLLTILLDLVLLKRGVYRHLLYNRGAEPRRLTGKKTPSGQQHTYANRKTDRWSLILRLGLVLVLLDAFIRWSYLDANRLSPDTLSTSQAAIAFLRVFLGTVAETVAFHGGVTLACYLIMKFLDLFKASSPKTDIRQQFDLSLIPLSLFYSSITKLFLLFLLTIWLPQKQTTPSPPAENTLPSWTKLITEIDNTTSSYLIGALQILDDDKLDREWIVRNILGGMSAGFGLRVILDIHPAFTTFIILAGWAAKTAVATLVSRWVGGNDMARDAWLAYSIP